MHADRQNINKKEMAISFLKQIASGKIREAYAQFVGSNFSHHNPYFKGDAESLMLAMEEDATQNPNKSLEVILAIQEDDQVAVYSYLKQNPDDLGSGLVHIFRFQKDKIVEMWDIGQALPEDSPNENGMF
ncbi:nuclear transport factor 2 family protein [Salirhabdus sp. Marseille-P4669]|uniref:nuclear transport factor 2 family protein n=1 Tax=Salirhabdus sp. Marseille-P4669 TaxID=2042310 RepID=UPI000C7E3575|nr:polyketide cyclase [Salirhabdus sp. Marseille-P4669]